MGYRKTLVTVDGSPFSEQAFEPVLRIAESGTQIHILSVLAPDIASEVNSLASARAQSTGAAALHWPQTDTLPIDPHEHNARQKYVTQWADWLAQAGYDVSWEVRSGPIAATVLDVARQGFEVIVMATHARTGISKAVLGSVTEAVLQQAPCPVFVIPPAIKVNQ